MSRLCEIAKELGLLYRGEKEAELTIWQLEQDIEGRELFLAPEGGWPGKNEQERKAARDRALAGDETLGKIRALVMRNRERASQIAGNIAALEAERRALEWDIRDRLAARMAGYTEESPTGGSKDASGVDILITPPVREEISLQDEIPF